MRVDTYLVDKGLCSSRNKAKDLLLKGGVKVNGVVVSKPSMLVSDADFIDIDSVVVAPYVSKGGLKLKKAIDSFALNFKGKTIIDIGASTGGFTDCALKHGAKFVWAIDVGTAQLVQELKNDIRVCSLENTDFRTLNPLIIETPVDIVVGDLSFISLKHIVKHIPIFLRQDGFAVLLIKPQFEVGPMNVDKRGIVKNFKAHVLAINEIIDSAKEHGLYLSKLTFAPIIDAKKNIEYLAVFDRCGDIYVDVNKEVTFAFDEKKGCV